MKRKNLLAYIRDYLKNYIRPIKLKIITKKVIKN